MSTTGSFPFNDLPVELQREIFVVAASSSQRNALQLALVAKRVKSWVQPSIYEMVTLGADDTALFLGTVDSVPSSFFAIHVKKLCLSVSVSASNAAQILNVCRGVLDLAFWVDYLGAFPSLSMAPLLCSLPLSRLSIEHKHFLSLFADPQKRHRWFNTLTHLDLIFWTHETAPKIPHLEKLTHLTHLALRLRHRYSKDSSLHTILSACRRLKVLVIFDDAETSEEDVWAHDHRVVYMPYPANVVHEWEAQAKRESNCVWSRAEDLVRRHTAERESLYPLS